MTRHADIKDPRGATVLNLEGIAKESALCIDKIKNGIASLANILEDYPDAVTDAENRMLNEVFSPILDIIEGYAAHVKALREAAKLIDEVPMPVGEILEEERIPAAASITKEYLRQGEYVYRRRNTPVV